MDERLLSTWQRTKAAGYYSIGFTTAMVMVFVMWVVVASAVRTIFWPDSFGSFLSGFSIRMGISYPIRTTMGFLFTITALVFPSSFTGSFIGLRRSPYWPQWYLFTSLMAGVAGFLGFFLVGISVAFVSNKYGWDHEASDLMFFSAMMGNAFYVSFFGAWLFSFLARTGRIVRKEGAVT